MAATRTLKLAILALAAGAVSHVRAEDMETCGDASYFPSEYNCYDDSALCPIMYNLPTLPCNGSTAGCYAGEMFSCEDGNLKTLPEATDPFTLTAHGTRPMYENLEVKACAGYLAVGANARECTSCKDAGPDVDCDSYGRDAVLLPNGEMAADVPGGQYWFVNNNDGALMYTAAMKNSTAPEKDRAGEKVIVYQDGFFAYDGEPHYWLACLRTLPGGVPGTGKTWRIFAPTYSNMERGDCEQIRLASKSVDRKQGAYQYD